MASTKSNTEKVEEILFTFIYLANVSDLLKTVQLLVNQTNKMYFNIFLNIKYYLKDFHSFLGLIITKYKAHFYRAFIFSKLYIFKSIII